MFRSGSTRRINVLRLYATAARISARRLEPLERLELLERLEPLSHNPVVLAGGRR